VQQAHLISAQVLRRLTHAASNTSTPAAAAAAIINHNVQTGGLIWTLLWAVLLRLEPARCNTLTVVLIICAGLAMASWGETQFSFVGLLLVMGAACAAGLRYV
jgi:drug/metabolite transporter (DMT)-like permease